ncbi:hypothetical protein HW555_013418 [Spodoptera exigua]|uniref:Uncharacterized protein n=1 Tax=Spodoptera exigua TaxID=7107 RepID=A0A835KY65_SPOEX|nr:hypothetical protein HW555_013418 [Spodoptera exigua]
MRAHLHGNTHSNFPQQLLKLGEGTFPFLNLDTNYAITLDETLGQMIHYLDSLIDAIYPDIENLHKNNFRWLCCRPIVSPRNETVNAINNLIMQKVPGEVKCYKPSLTSRTPSLTSRTPSLTSRTQYTIPRNF